MLHRTVLIAPLKKLGFTYQHMSDSGFSRWIKTLQHSDYGLLAYIVYIASVDGSEHIMLYGPKLNIQTHKYNEYAKLAEWRTVKGAYDKLGVRLETEYADFLNKAQKNVKLNPEKKEG